MTSKIIITGYRDFDDNEVFEKTMNEIEMKYGEIIELSCGDCRGADLLARNFCKKRKIKNNVYKADWDNLGLKAGPVRNEKMVDECLNYNVLVAFVSKKSKGTIQCINYAKKKKMNVFEVKID